MKDELPKSLYSFIWYFLKPHKIIVSIFISLAIIAGFWPSFNSLLIKNVVDLLPQINGNVHELLIPIGLIAINFIIFDNVTWRGITFIQAKYAPIIINNIISASTNHALEHSNKFFQDNLSGKIAKHISNLADGIDKMITDVASNFFRGASLLLTAFIVSYFANPLFCLILIVWFIFFASISFVMSRKLMSLSDKQAQTESTVVGQIVDSISNQSSIRIFSKKLYEIRRMIPFLDKQREAYQNTYFYSLFMHSVQAGMIAIMMLCSAYSLVYLYSKNLVTIGDFVLILGLSMETGHMMWYTMSKLDEFNKAVGKCKQSLYSIMQPLEIIDAEDAKDFHCTNGKITFDNVKFHYKRASPLFENKSVIIEPGQKVGLVGYSGSGKSTFVNLILRFYEVTDGKILIDDQDISQVTQESLRNNIAMIPQDPSLFHRSLIENIRYGNIEATDKEVIEAAKKAHAHEFILHLTQGYDALVGEKGVKLSGGQRQRIAIARAILKNSPILILDEATSQLDSITENQIQDSIAKLMQDKTSIIIAHRLSTLLNMDRILVFDQGKIVEDGNHQALLRKNGVYKSLWDAQVGGFLPKKK